MIACMTIIDLHLMFFMHALVAILDSVGEGMAVADFKFDRRGRELGKLEMKFKSKNDSW